MSWLVSFARQMTTALVMCKTMGFRSLQAKKYDIPAKDILPGPV